MDRDWLEAQLAAGRSIESIAREVGKHPSTVGYWVNKHGLTSQHAARHAARGGARARDRSRRSSSEGLSIREIGERLGVSYDDRPALAAALRAEDARARLDARAPGRRRARHRARVPHARAHGLRPQRAAAVATAARSAAARR